MAVIRESVAGVWRHPWLTVAGLLFGVIVAPLINFAVGLVATWYYMIVPIAVMSGEVTLADADQIIVHLRVVKREVPDCKFISLRARTIDAGGEYELAHIARIDRPDIGEVLPTGRHDIGLWRVIPRSDGVLVRIAPVYDCGGRVVWGVPAMLALPAVSGGKVS